MDLHPAENRGYRELILTSREAQTRLERLAEHLGPAQRRAAERAAATLVELLAEIQAELVRHDLHGELAARGGGARIGMVRSTILDRFLERNQALRFAVDDLEHVTTLLAYLATVSETRGDARLPELCRGWERRMRRQVTAMRKATVALGAEPDAAIEPLDRSPVGRVAHGSALAVGAVGEAVDRKVARRRLPRLRRSG